jgi:hypothetical protein
MNSEDTVDSGAKQRNSIADWILTTVTTGILMTGILSAEMRIMEMMTTVVRITFLVVGSRLIRGPAHG